jgi:hypothetical protein
MGTDFALQEKCTIFWLNIGLRVYLDLYVPDFPKSTFKYFLYPSNFSPKHPLLEAFLLIKTPQTCKNRFGPKKIEKFVKNTFVILFWKGLNN